MALLTTIEEVYAKKNEIQEEMYKAMEANNFRGQVYAATGVGKTRLAILGAHRRHIDAEPGELLLMVPTVRLRDDNWKKEFIKWSTEELYNKFERTCYVSANKISGKHFKYVILDEAHHITAANSEFFRNNKVDEIIMMTATEPNDALKKFMLDSLGPVVYNYTLEDGIRDGIIPPFWLYVIEVDLDNTDKYILAGNKANRFYQTEKSRYEYLSKRLEQARIMNQKSGNRKAYLEHAAMNARTSFITGLRSKTWIAKCVLDNIPEDSKVILFCGGIEQAEKLLPGQTYHSMSNSDALIAFQEGLINRLGTVRAVNEGINIDSLDTAIIIQINSQDKDLIQRIGRVVRWKDDLVEPVIYVIVARDTQDVAWFEKATAGLNQDRIKYIGWKNYSKTLYNPNF